uniref:Si:ch73-52p7.1 n=1 Tax=Sinocyclocheilus grahami TaxID=75366 RepID=A0A672NFZ1_SINGR
MQAVRRAMQIVTNEVSFQLGCLLCCILWLAAPAFLRSEFKVAYVTERSVYMCTCAQDLTFCEKMNSSEFSNCKDQSSVLHRAESPSPVHRKNLTVWYSSPLNVALLLNNSEVQHLSLIQCKPAAEQPVPFEYFTVQRLETLTVTYPFWKPGQSYKIIIGKDRDAPFHEEARIAVIHTSVLTGKTELKSYTVQTNVDRSGMMSFPNIFMSRNGILLIFFMYLYK